MTTNSQAAILERIIEQEDSSMSPDLARYVLTLDFRESDHNRMEELSVKAQEGQLTPDEEEELDNYVQTSHFLALMQSKARVTLKRTGGG